MVFCSWVAIIHEFEKREFVLNIEFGSVKKGLGLLMYRLKLE
jgi:hypothetical protein